MKIKNTCKRTLSLFMSIMFLLNLLCPFMEVNTQTVHAEEARANDVDWSSALITKDELKSDYNTTGSGKEANILFGKEGIRWIVVGSEDDGNLVFYSRDSLGNSQFYTSVARADAGINYVNSTLRETVQSCEKDESLFKSKEQNLMMITKLNDLNIEDKLYALYGIDYWQYHTPVYAGSSYDKAVNTAYWCDGDSWLRTVYLDDEEGWAKACLSGNARDIFTTDYDMSFGVSAAFKFDTDKLEFVASSEISETETDSFSEVTNSNKKYYLRLVDSDSKVAGSVSSVEDGKVSYTAAEGERLVVLVSANDTTYAYVKNGTGEKETLDLSEISNFPESESYDVKAWVEKKESDANSPLYYASDVVTSSFTKTETEEEEVVEEEIGGESQIDWGEVTVIPGIEGGWSDVYLTGEDVENGGYNTSETGKTAYVKNFHLDYELRTGKDNKWIIAGVEDDGNMVLVTKEPTGSGSIFNQAEGYSSSYQNEYKDSTLYSNRNGSLYYGASYDRYIQDSQVTTKSSTVTTSFYQLHANAEGDTVVYAGTGNDLPVASKHFPSSSFWTRTAAADSDSQAYYVDGDTKSVKAGDCAEEKGIMTALKIKDMKFLWRDDPTKEDYMIAGYYDDSLVPSIEDGKITYNLTSVWQGLIVMLKTGGVIYQYVIPGSTSNGEDKTIDIKDLAKLSGVDLTDSAEYSIKSFIVNDYCHYENEDYCFYSYFFVGDVVEYSYTPEENESDAASEEVSPILITKDELKSGDYNTTGSGKIGYVKFGKSDIRWIVAGKESDGNLVLFSQDSLGKSAYNNETHNTEYSGSTLQTYLQGLTTDTTYFGTAEQNLMLSTVVNTRSTTVTDKLYPLYNTEENEGSCTEVYAGTDNDVCVSETYWPSIEAWWLRRTKGEDSSSAGAYLIYDGALSTNLIDESQDYDTAAAFKLDTDKLKFVASSSISESGTDSFSEVTNSDNQYCLRLENSSVTGSVSSVEDGKVSYTAAEGERLVVLVSANGTTYAYVKNGTGEGETLDLSEIGNFPESESYDVKAWVEKKAEDTISPMYYVSDVTHVVSTEETESDAASEEVSPILITKDELKSGDYNTTGSGKIAHILFGKEGIRWVVVGQEDDGNLIFYSRNFISDEAIYRCDEAGTVGRIEYSESYLRSKIQEYQNSTDYFKTTEQDLMLNTTLSDQSVDVSDKLYPLYTDCDPNNWSYTTTVYAGGNYNKAVECIYCPLWEGDEDSTFLRSPYDNEGYDCVNFVATNIDTEEITAACVGYSDAPSASKRKVTAAFKLDTDKLKFVASSSISESETDSFSEVTNSDNQYCLRLENSSVTGSVSSVENGKVSYTAADDERLVVLVSANDTTYAYVKNGTGGKLNLNSIDGLTNGKEYSVKAWVEKKESDAHSPLYYASDVVTSSFTKTEVVEEEEDETEGEDNKSDSEITESVTPNWKNECESIDTIKSDYNASGSGKIGYVKFGKSDIRWVIAGKESDGNLVLFSQDSLGKSTGGRYESNSGDYKDSDLQRYIQSLLENEEYFKNVETDLMLSTTVDTEYGTVTDKLYPLYNESTTEGSCPELYAGAGNDIRICSDCWPSVDTWWLRRACGLDAIYIVKDNNLEIEIMYIDKTGGSYDTAAAFKLDSSKIRFMSGSSLPTDDTKNFIKLSDTSDNTFCLRLKSDSIGSVSLTKDGEVTYTATDSDGRLVVLANDGTSTYCHIKASASGTNQVLDLNAIEGLTNGTEYSVKAWVEKTENDANSPLYYASDVVTSSFTKTEVVEEEETESVSDSGSISGSDSEASKADPVYIEPTNLTATYGQKLREVDLNEKSESNENSESTTPGTWKWDDGDVYVGEVGTNEFAATFIPDDTENYNTLGKLLEVKVLADTSGWGEKIEIEGSGHSIYVGSDGTLSAEVFPKSVVWVQQLLASSGKSNWYGLDNSDDRYRSGSKFSVKCLSKTENADEWNSYYDSLGDSASTCGTSVLLIGVTDPDGEEYSLLSDDEDSATLYIQLNSDTGDSEEVDHSDILVVTSSGAAQVSEAYYVDDVSYPGGSGNFTKLVLTSASSTKSSTTSTSSTDDETEEDTEEDTENSEDEENLDETEVDQEDDNSYSTIGSSRSKNKNGDDDSTQDESSSKTLNDMQMILLVCISGVFIASVLLYVYLKKRNKK